jgi:hypothetical protein
VRELLIAWLRCRMQIILKMSSEICRQWTGSASAVRGEVNAHNGICIEISKQIKTVVRVTGHLHRQWCGVASECGGTNTLGVPLAWREHQSNSATFTFTSSVTTKRSIPIFFSLQPSFQALTQRLIH